MCLGVRVCVGVWFCVSVSVSVCMSVSVCVGGGVRFVAVSVRACVGCLCMYVWRGWVASAIPPTAVCKHFCSPARPHHPRQSSEWAGKGAWVRLLRGAWARKWGASSWSKTTTLGGEGPGMATSLAVAEACKRNLDESGGGGWGGQWGEAGQREG